MDPDNQKAARKALAAFDVDLNALGATGWHIRSPRTDSGGRYTFSDPGGLRWMRLRVRDVDDPKRTHILFELRAGSDNLQDVLPGSAHPDGGYWSADPLPDGDLPPPPNALLDLWQRWQDNPKDVETVMYDALDIPASRRIWAINNTAGKLAYASPCRVAFNEMHEVEDILREHGYKEHGGRWAHPGATGAPGCQPITGKDGLWQSHNGGDPLCGTFDAWIAHVVLNHDYDCEAARTEFMREHPDQALPGFQPVQRTDDADEEAAADMETEALLHSGAPILPAAAYPGLLGEIVATACANTEAVPATVAAAALGMYATRFGRFLHVDIGDERISLNLYILSIGPTGWGRKGTSRAMPGRIFDLVDARLNTGMFLPVLPYEDRPRNLEIAASPATRQRR